eukprot:1268606-Rhodomonas_salina.1
MASTSPFITAAAADARVSDLGFRGLGGVRPERGHGVDSIDKPCDHRLRGRCKLILARSKGLEQVREIR